MSAAIPRKYCSDKMRLAPAPRKAACLMIRPVTDLTFHPPLGLAAPPLRLSPSAGLDQILILCRKSGREFLFPPTGVHPLSRLDAGLGFTLGGRCPRSNIVLEY